MADEDSSSSEEEKSYKKNYKKENQKNSTKVSQNAELNSPTPLRDPKDGTNLQSTFRPSSLLPKYPNNSIHPTQNLNTIQNPKPKLVHTLTQSLSAWDRLRRHVRKMQMMQK